MHPQVSWILSRQVALTIVLAIAAGLVFDVNAAVSVVVGGSIGVVANLGYVLRAMRMSSANDPVKVYQAQAAGEGFKLQGCGSIAAFSWIRINLCHLLGGIAEATLG